MNIGNLHIGLISGTTKSKIGTASVEMAYK